MIVYPLGVVGPWQIVIIALVILLLFGGKKIPELMKGLGKGVKSFKEGINEVEEQINTADTPSKPAEAPKAKEEPKEPEAWSWLTAATSARCPSGTISRN